jgi:hypothetical protein
VVTTTGQTTAGATTGSTTGGGGSTGTCGNPPLGDAAADVQAAGFTTCALYSDFTTPIPNTVGTGLPANWLNCAGTSDPATWYLGQYPFYGYSNLKDSNPCVSGPSANSGNSQIFQTSDPVYGNTALEIVALASPSCPPESNSYFHRGDGITCSNGIGTADTNRDVAAPNPGQFGYFYVELAARTDFPGGPSYTALASTAWVTRAEMVRNGSNPSDPLVMPEIDIFEEGTNGWDTGLHFWSNTDPGPNQLANGPYNDTAYHTWGALWLGDGNGHVEMCSYKDGTRLSCWSGIEDNPFLFYERHYIVLYATSDGTNSEHNYYKYVKVWTCPSGVAGSTNSQMCNISPLPAF